MRIGERHTPIDPNPPTQRHIQRRSWRLVDAIRLNALTLDYARRLVLLVSSILVEVSPFRLFSHTVQAIDGHGRRVREANFERVGPLSVILVVGGNHLGIALHAEGVV